MPTFPSSATYPSAPVWPAGDAVYDVSVYGGDSYSDDSATSGTFPSQYVLAVVRRNPPLRVHIDITTPSGRHYRWAMDDPEPENRPSGHRHSDTMPGGFENWSATLPRKPGVDYADLEMLSTIKVTGPAGETVGEYRLDSVPRTSGDQMAVTPAAVGFQAALDDDKFAREIYVHRDMTAWQEPSAQRRLDNLGANARNLGEFSVAADATTGVPSLITKVTGAWSRATTAEALFDAHGIPLGELRYAWTREAGISAADAQWTWDAFLATNDTLVSTDTTGNLRAAGPGNGTLSSTTSDRVFASVRLMYGTGPSGDEGREYGVYWNTLAVFGKHGLTVRVVSGAPDGLYASDVVTHAVQKFAPQLNIRNGSVQQSSFVIPHLAFLEPTTCGEIVRQASRFDLPDWGVWEDKTFFWAPQGANAKRWRARIGPSQLEETGPQVARLWESIVVQYQDVDGSTRTVGPPGSGADTESANLKDSDPENPANKLGLVKRDLLQMGTSTAAGATEVGRRFLIESRLLDRSGKARAVGWVEDDRGVLHPYWAPRAGDEIAFLDASDKSYRRIVRTEKDHDARTVTFDLDAPPEGLQQLLERLNVVLVPLGIGS